MFGYLLAESVSIIDTSVDFMRDARLGDVREYCDVVTTVGQSVRGDSSHGVRNLNPPRRGDNDVTITWTSDRRVSSVSYPSVGVGSKIVGAGVKIITTIAATAIRSSAAIRLFGLDDKRQEPEQAEAPKGPPDPAAVRAAWEAANPNAVDHRKTYADIAGAATERLAGLRKELVEASIEPAATARKLTRIRQLEDVRGVALKEIAKVEAMFTAWSESAITHFPQRITYALELDELPEHTDPMSSQPTTDPKTQHDQKDVWNQLWTQSRIWVEVGPGVARQGWRPNPTGVAMDDPVPERVYWRVPYPARLWVWRQDDAGEPVLEKTIDVMVANRFSQTDSLPLDGRFFGEAAVELVFDELGSPTKLVQGDKSAAGAIADALLSVPDQVAAGLETATKIGTSVGDLQDAAAKRRLETINRLVDQRAKELELQGINATAESYAEQKRLEQQVAIAKAQGSLAPASELSRLQNELAEATARRDLEAVSRERAQASELAEVRAELAKLEAQLDIIRIKVQHDGDGE